ncbi:MAG: hypothetical protein J2P17_17510, partial [Mycobacterium sp.]|nr:hypothetical protein [Mycobacterium sp.]
RAGAPKGGVMDNFANDVMTVVSRAPVPLGIGVGGLSQLASGGRNGAVSRCDLYGGGAVRSSSIEDIDATGLTRPPPDAALSGCDRSWGVNFSSMPRGRVRSCCVIRQLTGANVSDAGVPA